MVEGLTSSATDQGSVAGNRDRIHDMTHESKIDDQSAPAPAMSGRARSQPNNIQTQRNPGDSSGEAIPVPIPNTEVKLSSAEDTERAAFRENRSSPGFLRFREVSRAVRRHDLGRRSVSSTADDRPRR